MNEFMNEPLEDLDPTYGFKSESKWEQMWIYFIYIWNISVLSVLLRRMRLGLNIQLRLQEDQCVLICH